MSRVCIAFVFSFLLSLTGFAAKETLVNRGYVMDFPLAVESGQVPNVHRRYKFGRNGDVDPGSTPEDIWGGGSVYTGQPSPCPSEKAEVFSDDADDNSSGTGLRTVSLAFLNDSYQEISETVSLNGLTGVQTLSNVCRVLRLKGLSAGSSGGSEGAITVRNVTTTANVFAVVPAGKNQTQVGPFSIPEGKIAVIDSGFLSITRVNGSPGSAEVELRVRDFGGIYTVRRNFEISTESPLVLGPSITFDEKSDISFEIVDVSDTNTKFVTEVIYYLVDK